MYRKLGDTIYLDFTVHLPTTGAVSDADALPTVEVFEDATDTTLSGATVTKRTDKTGNYRVAVAATTGNGFEVGKSYNVVVTVVAGGVTAKAVIGSFFIDSKRLADLNDLGGTAQTGDVYAQVGVAGAGLTAIKNKTDLIPASPAAIGDAMALTGAYDAAKTAAQAGDAMNLTPAYDAAKNAAPESGGNIEAVKAKTDNLPSDPADESNVQGHVADALAAYKPPTKAEMDEALASLNDITVADILAGNLADSLSFPANSLADRLRKLFWIICNRLAIVDATGAFTAYKGDGVTPGATGTITDNGTNTIRSAPTWP